MSSLKLSRPLITLDVETTGPDHHVDRVCQIGIVKLYPDGKQTEWESLVNPEVVISEEMVQIHHVTNEMVAKAPKFAELAPMLAQGLSDVDFCGFNLQFDLDFMISEFNRARVPHSLRDVQVVDVWHIFKMMKPRNLTAAVKEYLNEEHYLAHTALGDAKATLRVFLRQLEMHPELPSTVEELHALLFETIPPGSLDPDSKIVWRNGKAVLNFGKLSGTPLEKVDRDYLEWILRKDFNKYIRKIAQDALNGIYPEK